MKCFGSCFPFHKWSKWEQYTWEGTVVQRFGAAAGKTFPMSEDRQKRKCERCGKVQDERIC
jgi:hypothetical protein